MFCFVFTATELFHTGRKLLYLYQVEKDNEVCTYYYSIHVNMYMLMRQGKAKQLHLKTTSYNCLL